MRKVSGLVRAAIASGCSSITPATAFPSSSTAHRRNPHGADLRRRIGASSFTFAKASPDWIDARVRAFEAIGGVPEFVVPDHAKTAIVKASFYDPQVNRTYAEMAPKEFVVDLWSSRWFDVAGRHKLQSRVPTIMTAELRRNATSIISVAKSRPRTAPRRAQACLPSPAVARRPSTRDLGGLTNARKSVIKLGGCRFSASAER